MEFMDLNFDISNLIKYVLLISLFAFYGWGEFLLEFCVFAVVYSIRVGKEKCYWNRYNTATVMPITFSDIRKNFTDFINKLTVIYGDETVFVVRYEDDVEIEFMHTKQIGKFGTLIEIIKTYSYP